MPPLLPFPHPWRAYQARVLADLDAHLADERLHIVAPPGSGKTVIGLEVVRRLARPALVLAPTVALREQWIDRLCADFLGGVSRRPDWVSTELAAPTALTIATYQAVFAAFDEAVADPVRRWDVLRDAGVAVLVCDEAHHLKRAWWEALDDLRAALAPTVVALTATPPYDVGAREWARYSALAGPVDAEIGVPELIAAGDLAPHQDLLYLTPPDRDEAAALRTDRARIDGLLDDLLADAALARALAAHPPLVDPEHHLDAVLDAPAGVRAACAYLSASSHAGPPRRLLAILGVDARLLPPFGYAEAEDLLAYLLPLAPAAEEPDVDDASGVDDTSDPEGEGADPRAESDPADEPEVDPPAGRPDDPLPASRELGVLCDLPQLLAAYPPRLRRLGVLHGRGVDLRRRRHRLRLLRAAANKLTAIANIARAESATRGADLRLVVLTDFIRREWLGRPGTPTQLGAVPAWETLVDALPADVPTGLLTGSLVILPIAALATEPARAAGLTGRPLAHRPAYREVGFTEADRPGVVAAVTALLTAGHLRALVGTRALLGEGWDAPALNALVLASASAAFVTANQTRGRALRRRGNKVANVWHLACVDSDEPGGGPDVDLLRRRFRAFAGVTHDGPPRVADGLRRLGLDVGDLPAHNARALAYAAELDRVRARWAEAVRHDAEVHERVEVRLGGEPHVRERREVYRSRACVSGAWALGSAAAAAGMSAWGALERWGALAAGGGWWPMLLAVLGGSVAVFLAGRTWQWRAHVRRERVAVDTAGGVGQAVVEALRGTDLLGRGRRVAAAPLRAEVEREPGGAGATVLLRGGTRAGARTAAASLAEALGPVGGSRYVLRAGGGFTGVAVHYVAVPKALGVNKFRARRFAEAYRRHVGRCELVFARSEVGRRALLWAGQG